ncbi:hypothetical protein F2P81_007580 [Scophthalmus maximus]|uniref:DNA-directed DNA polymerase n=1 Tax=Scophthalmus maximus TaxID=52904 RepID=A0A6A4T2M4_SCOMX|nr:hypothetical protein F2P81_007580 [Scophthalmus maximus]
MDLNITDMCDPFFAINRAIAQIEANQHEQPDNQINPSKEPMNANNIVNVQHLDFYDFYNALNNLQNQQVDAAHQESSTIRRKRFNNVEIVQPFDNVRREEELNYAEYYSRVMGDEGDRDLLNSFIDRIVESNMTVSVNSNLHVVAQIIRNPHGAGKRLLAETLDSKILKKKRRFLYVVENEHNSLCFGMNVAHLLNPNITDNEALTIGKRMQNSAGMSDDTAVTVIDILKFEAQLNCKIVVLFRTDAKRNLSKFETDSPRKDDTLFLFLNENHYYGIISEKAFLGCKNTTKYVDSLSFLTMHLADMPKALGFEDAVKGFFPHGFSSENTLNYVGPHPPPQTYGLERMSGNGKREFETWYETVRHGTFHFKNEAVRYCQYDVDILFEACCIFRKGYIGETGVDPFSCVTIASACMKVFRKSFLAANTLAIPSPDNYRRHFKSFSNVSIQWLE